MGVGQADNRDDDDGDDRQQAGRSDVRGIRQDWTSIYWTDRSCSDLIGSGSIFYRAKLHYVGDPMATLSFQNPTDQPLGRSRLLHDIHRLLNSEDFNAFFISVAYAKLGPLLRLETDICNWRDRNNEIVAIFGVDQNGTSQEALEFALQYFNKVHIAHSEIGLYNATFHPKIYVFSGEARATAIIGSNNLTVGGFETNFECNVKLEMELPQDNDNLTSVMGCWEDGLNASIELTEDILEELRSNSLVISENQMRRKGNGTHSGSSARRGKKCTLDFPDLKVLPPIPLPKNSQFKSSIPASTDDEKEDKKSSTGEAPESEEHHSVLGANAFILQITPHHNGEIFLSKTAVNQDPTFFGFPFTGHSVPKKKGNPAYPQREPDPIVNIVVFDDSGAETERKEHWALNTIYYSAKSEIRITFPPDLARSIPDGSIMIMRFSGTPDLDYDLRIYHPGSEEFNTYLELCPHKMPSGGKAVSRRFGWI